MRRFSEYLADTLKLPKDVLMDLPVVTVCGDREIYIENHKGLAGYTAEEIRIKMRGGMMRISGSGLRIAVMEHDRIVVSGVFRSVGYE